MVSGAMTVRAGLVLIGLVLLGKPLAAQYPLAPSPVFDLRNLTHDVRLGGYASVRQVERGDTVTFTSIAPG